MSSLSSGAEDKFIVARLGYVDLGELNRYVCDCVRCWRNSMPYVYALACDFVSTHESGTARKRSSHELFRRSPKCLQRDGNRDIWLHLKKD